MRLRVHQLHHQRVCLPSSFLFLFLFFLFFFVFVIEKVKRSFFWVDEMIIFFWMSRASDKCQREKRKTINGDDLLWAMATLGFEDYIDPLKVYLTRYREVIFC